jgi:hypothetical protein
VVLFNQLQFVGSNAKITTTDTTPPVTTASVAGPLGLNNWYTGPTTVTFSATDDLSVVAQTQYRLGSSQSWTSGTGVSFAASGIYNVQYQSIDVDGNVETPDTITVRLDSRAPVISENADTSVIFNYLPVASLTIDDIGQNHRQPVGSQSQHSEVCRS